MSPVSTHLASRVGAVLATLRPQLQADGGDIELLGVDPARGRVELRLLGACRTCAAAAYTLALTVEARLRRELPAIEDIVAL